MPTILLKRSNTPGAVPGTANLTNLSGGAEVAVNTADKRMFALNSSSAVVELGTNPSSLTCADASLTVARIGSLTLTNALGRAQGGTGLSTTPSNGQLLIGNGSGYTLATLTAGTNITLTNATGSISIAAAAGVTLPGSSTDNAVVRWDGTGGNSIQNSALTVNDSGNITTAGDALINNVYIGRKYTPTGGGPDQNLVIGQSAAISLMTLGTQNLNTIVGNNAGNGLTGASGTGNFNTMFGYGAGGNGANTSSNTFVGYLSGYNIGSTGNVAVGHAAMQGGGGNSAASNTAVGFQALLSVDTGGQNVAVGNGAGDAITSGNWNTCIGALAGTNVSTAAANTLIGYNSGAGISTGTTNTAIGDTAYLTGNYSGSSCLGYDSAVTGSSQVQLGNSSTTTYAYGAVQDRSDARDKADIRDTQLGLSFIMALRPRDFKWDMREDYRPAKPSQDATPEEWEAFHEACKMENLAHDGSKKRSRFHHGLIAQEVKQTMDAMGVDFGGYQDHKIKGGQDVLSLGYEEMIAPLIKAIQELKAEFDEYKRTHP